MKKYSEKEMLAAVVFMGAGALLGADICSSVLPVKRNIVSKALSYTIASAIGVRIGFMAFSDLLDISKVLKGASDDE